MTFIQATEIDLRPHVQTASRHRARHYSVATQLIRSFLTVRNQTQTAEITTKIISVVVALLLSEFLPKLSVISGGPSTRGGHALGYLYEMFIILYLSCLQATQMSILQVSGYLIAQVLHNKGTFFLHITCMVYRSKVVFTKFGI